MLHVMSLVYLQYGNAKKPKKLMKIVNIDKKNLQIFHLRNFHEIFRENGSYDNIKSHKKYGFTLFLENTDLEKPQGGVKLIALGFLGLKT